MGALRRHGKYPSEGGGHGENGPALWALKQLDGPLIQNDRFSLGRLVAIGPG